MSDSKQLPDSDLADSLHNQIKEYADTHKISYSEAAKLFLIALKEYLGKG